MAIPAYYNSNPNLNVSINGISIGEGMQRKDINDAFRQLMADFKNWTDSYTPPGTVATLNVMTAAQYRNNTASKVLTTDTTWAAVASVTLTPGTNVSVDMGGGINFTLAMGGNYNLSNPTNVKDGQSGKIEITQDATGSRLLTYSNNWLFAGGTDPVLTTTAGAIDVLTYVGLKNGKVLAAINKGIG